jgi:hypothetical protein
MSFSIVQDHELVLAKEAAREAGRAPINLKPWRAWVSSTVRYDRRRRVAALCRTTLADCPEGAFRQHP